MQEERENVPHPFFDGFLLEMVDDKLFHQASASLRVTTTLASGFAARISCHRDNTPNNSTPKGNKGFDARA